ncbi:MAG: cysteine hydrolase [Thermotogaceae bacterium]|nr:cysteine hydrolase [Thermotogaceae bacterium]
MRALLIVDLQRDFVDREGALYFEGAEKVVDYIVELAKKFREEDLPIITTQDWHDENDKEFEVWPRHCVAGSEGARLTEKLEEVLKGYNRHYYIRKTRFSAFYKTNFEELIKDLDLDEFEVAGVVTNICVLFTVEELRNRDLRVILHEKGVTSYDEDLHRFALREMKEVLGVEII